MNKKKQITVYIEDITHERLIKFSEMDHRSGIASSVDKLVEIGFNAYTKEGK